MDLKKRMFLIEKGNFVLIRDENQNEVFFESLDEFYRCAPIGEFGLDLSGVWNIDYELHRDVCQAFSEDGESIPQPSGPVAEYEALIDNIQTLIDRKNDRFFGVTLPEAQKLRKAQFKADAYGRFEEKYGYFDILDFLVDDTLDKTVIKNDYKALKGHVISKFGDIDLCADNDAVKAVPENDWPLI